MEEEQGSLKGNSNSGLVLGSFPPTFISDPLNFSKSQQEGASVGRAISCSRVNYLLENSSKFVYDKCREPSYLSYSVTAQFRWYEELAQACKGAYFGESVIRRAKWMQGFKLGQWSQWLARGFPRKCPSPASTSSLEVNKRARPPLD